MQRVAWVCQQQLSYLFKMAAVRHLGFLKVRNLNCRCGSEDHCASQCQRSNHCWDVAIFFIFAIWRQSAILDLLYAYWEDPRRVLGGLYRCAKFGRNRSSSFDNMPVSMFCEFGLKMPIHAHRLRVLTPYMGSYVNEPHNRHVLAQNDIVWRMDYQNQSIIPPSTQCIRRRNLTLANCVFFQTTHVVRSKSDFAWV